MGRKFDNISGIVTKGFQSFSSLIKVALLSKGASGKSEEGKGKELIILGNGPSLRTTIDRELEWLETHDLMAVNFAALSPEFHRLRPKYYILADGHFFNSLHTDGNVRRLWEIFSTVNWEMTLLIPTKYKHFAQPLLMNAVNIRKRYFNLTPVEGFKSISHILFNAGLGMPRPRNVMIPAIMEGIRMGYGKIYLCGADHSWTKTLNVDSENFVVSVQPHFYEDNKEEKERVRETYKGIKLHEVLGSMVVAFRSYWEIADFAKRRNVEIINATPDSMIDAFPRRYSEK